MMNWTKLTEDCEKAVLLEQIESRTERQRARDREARQQHERAAFRALQALLTRRVRRLVARHGGCLPLAVHVSPMINHANHTAQAWARVTWAHPGARFEFTGTIRDEEDLRALLRRVENSIAPNCV